MVFVPHFRDGKGNDKIASTPRGIWAHGGGAAIVFRDLPHHPKPDPAAAAGPEFFEHLKNFFIVFCGDAGAVVTNAEKAKSIGFPACDVDLPAGLVMMLHDIAQ